MGRKAPHRAFSDSTGLVTVTFQPVRAADAGRNTQGELVATTAPAVGVERLIDLGSTVARVHDGLDVATHRERTRQRRISKVAVFLGVIAFYLWWRILADLPLSPLHFHLTPTQSQMMPEIVVVIILACVLVLPLLGAGRSPHVRYQPSEIATGFA